MGIIIGVSLAGGSGRPVLGTSAARVLRAGFADLHPEAEPEERWGVNCNLAWDGGSNRTLVTEEYGKKMGFRKLDGRAMGFAETTVGAQSIARLCQNLINCRRNI